MKSINWILFLVIIMFIALVAFFVTQNKQEETEKSIFNFLK
jgi:hypothetical protein